jgi:hypothetical protein
VIFTHADDRERERTINAQMCSDKSHAVPVKIDLEFLDRKNVMQFDATDQYEYLYTFCFHSLCHWFKNNVEMKKKV